jgi:hypothetical protein
MVSAVDLVGTVDGIMRQLDFLDLLMGRDWSFATLASLPEIVAVGDAFGE